MSCIFAHDFIFFSPLKFNLIIRKLLFPPPLITLLWQTANFTDIRSLQHVLETKREKNDYKANHALWNQYDMLYPTIFFLLKTRKPSHQFYPGKEEICHETDWIITTIITLSKYNKGDCDKLREILKILMHLSAHSESQQLCHTCALPFLPSAPWAGIWTCKIE